MHGARAREVHLRLLAPDPDLHHQGGSVVQALLPPVDAVGERAKHRAHPGLGPGAEGGHVTLQGLHLPGCRAPPGLAGQSPQEGGPPVVGRHLRCQVHQVLLHGPRRMGAGGPGPEERPHPAPVRHAPSHQKPGRDDHALLGQGAGVGWHGAGARSPDLGVVGPAGQVAQPSRWVLPLGEDRGDHGHIREVGAAVSRMVGHRHVPWSQVQHGRDPAHAEAHGPQVDRDVRRVRHEFSVRIQEGAGEVQPFPDVHRKRGASELFAHLLHQGQKALHEELLLHGRRAFVHALVGPFAGTGVTSAVMCAVTCGKIPHRRAATRGRGPDSPLLLALQNQGVGTVHLRRPSHRYHRAPEPVDHQGRSGQRGAWAERFPIAGDDLLPPSVEPVPAISLHRGGEGGREGSRIRGENPGPGHHPQGGDLHPPPLGPVAEDGGIAGFEGLAEAGRKAGAMGAIGGDVSLGGTCASGAGCDLEGDLQRGFLSAVPELHDPLPKLHLFRGRGFASVLHDRPSGCVLQLGEPASQAIRHLVQVGQHLPVAEPFHPRLPEPYCAQDPRVCRHEDPAHSEAGRHGAGVLGPCSPEGHEDVVGGVVPLPDRDAADGVGHALVGQLHEALQKELHGGRLP